MADGFFPLAIYDSTAADCKPALIATFALWRGVMRRAFVFCVAATFPALAGATDPLQHPMLSSPGSLYTIGGEHRDLLVNGISNRAFVDLKVKWGTDGDKITRIPVCWDSPRPDHESYRVLVKNAVSQTWQLYSAIQFVNWGACTPKDTHAIHIAVGDFWPQSALGTQLEGRAGGMKLNFDFSAPADWTFCQSMRDSCVAKIAVHEFGHAIGFMHEQTRPDTPDNCLSAQPGEGQVPAGKPGYTTAGTPWDPQSIMNYCNPVWNNGGQLSALDVLALQTVYGVPHH